MSSFEEQYAIYVATVTQKIGERVSHGLRCRHLGQVVVQVAKDAVDCGCGQVSLFHCGNFNELTTRRPIKVESVAIVRNWNAKTIESYRGRTCVGCPELSS